MPTATLLSGCLCRLAVSGHQMITITSESIQVFSLDSDMTAAGLSVRLDVECILLRSGPVLLEHGLWFWFSWEDFKLLFTPVCGGTLVPERTVCYPAASPAAMDVQVVDLAAA